MSTSNNTHAWPPKDGGVYVRKGGSGDMQHGEELEQHNKPTASAPGKTEAAKQLAETQEKADKKSAEEKRKAEADRKRDDAKVGSNK